MAIKDLIPWNNRGREVGFQRGADIHPFFALHREMSRMFDDVFRGFDFPPGLTTSRTQDGLGWPQIDIDPPNCPVSMRRTSASKSQTAFSRSPARGKRNRKATPITAAPALIREACHPRGRSRGTYTCRTCTSTASR
jgi:hypothetical protein